MVKIKPSLLRSIDTSLFENSIEGLMTPLISQIMSPFMIRKRTDGFKCSWPANFFVIRDRKGKLYVSPEKQ